MFKIKSGFAATLIIGVFLAGSGIAHAEDSAEDAGSTVFEKAEQSLSYSPEDVTYFDPGVSVDSVKDDSNVTAVTASLGDFDVTVTPESTESDVTELAHGARVMSLLEDGQTSTEFRIDLPESTELQQDGAGYLIVGKTDDASITLGRIEEPWAVDRNGDRVETTYDYSEGTLTQRIVGDDIAYPVVADPTISFRVHGPGGPGIYWNIKGSIVKGIAMTGVGIVTGAIAGGCYGAKKIPRVGTYIAAVCSFVGAPTLGTMWSAMQSVAKSTAVSNNSCYSMLLHKSTASGTPKLYKVESKYCK